jgi:hypothetical protein
MIRRPRDVRKIPSKMVTVWIEEGISLRIVPSNSNYFEMHSMRIL